MDHYQFNPITGQLDLVNNAADIDCTAGVTLGGQRMVTIDGQARVIPADQSNAAHAGRILGLTRTSAAAGDTVSVRRFGPVDDPGWQWDVRQPRIFLSSNGTLTQTVPTSGFLCVVGFCLSATRLFIDIQPAINLT